MDPTLVILKDSYGDGWGATTLNLYSSDSDTPFAVTLDVGYEKTENWCNPSYAAWGNYGQWLSDVSVEIQDGEDGDMIVTIEPSAGANVLTPIWCSGWEGSENFVVLNGQCVETCTGTEKPVEVDGVCYASCADSHKPFGVDNVCYPTPKMLCARLCWLKK